MGPSHGALHPFLPSPLQSVPHPYHLQGALPDYAQLLQDGPSSPSSFHLEKEAGKEVPTGRCELPKKGMVGQGREGGESWPLLQHLLRYTAKEAGWDAPSYLPRAAVSTDLLEAPGLL